MLLKEGFLFYTTTTLEYICRLLAFSLSNFEQCAPRGQPLSGGTGAGKLGYAGLWARSRNLRGISVVSLFLLLHWVPGSGMLRDPVWRFRTLGKRKIPSPSPVAPGKHIDSC
jgi:hypothetical protein